MSVKERYGTMMDNSFGGYYDLFRKQKALSSDTAVTMETLFDGTKPTAADRQMIRKMVSFGVVKKSGDDGLWLDEGTMFGPEGTGFERFVLACPRHHLEKALERLDDAARRQRLPR